MKIQVERLKSSLFCTTINKTVHLAAILNYFFFFASFHTLIQVWNVAHCLYQISWPSRHTSTCIYPSFVPYEIIEFLKINIFMAAILTKMVVWVVSPCLNFDITVLESPLNKMIPFTEDIKDGDLLYMDPP